MFYNDFCGNQISRLGMGNMRLPTKKDGDKTVIDHDAARTIIDLGMSGGVNYYDTAFGYHDGESEGFLGAELVARYPRDSFYLATKYNLAACGPDYAGTFETQLKRLGTDHVDYYLLHSITDSRVDEYLSNGCIEYFMEQKQKGRIGHLGFSTHASPAVLERVASYREWEFAQMQLNYYDWMYGTAKEEYEILASHGIPVIVMEPVRGGRLATLSESATAMLSAAHPEWSNPQWAFNFVKSLPAVMLVLSGMSEPQQMQQNLATFADNEPLSEQDKQTLLAACEAFKNEISIPCTACRYCCNECPMSIEIPSYLELYNRFKLRGASAIWGYNDIESVGKPTDCIACGACAAVCPQNIAVNDLIGEIAALAEKLPKE